MSAWEEDEHEDFMPSEEDPVVDQFFEDDVEGDLMPLVAARDYNYPTENDTRYNVVYGFANQFLGNMISSVLIPRLNVISNLDGTITVTLEQVTTAVEIEVLAINESNVVTELGIMTSGSTEEFAIGSGTYAIFGQLIDGSEIMSNHTNAQLKEVANLEGDCGTIDLISSNSSPYKVMRNRFITDELGFRQENRVVTHMVSLWIQPVSAVDIKTLDRFSIVVTHLAFTTDDPFLIEGDQLVGLFGDTYKFNSGINASAENSVWEIALESYQV